MTNKYIWLFLVFQVALHSAVVLCAHNELLPGTPELHWLLIGTALYLAIVGALYLAIFEYKDISPAKVAAYFLIVLGAVGLIVVLYIPPEAVEAQHPYKAALISIGWLLTLFQIFVMALFVFITKQCKDKALRRAEETDYIFWGILLLAIYTTAFNSYELNIQRVFTGEFDEVARRHVWFYDYARSNFNISIASILGLPGLTTLAVVILSHLQPQTTKNVANNRWARFKKFWEPVNPGYVGDPIGSVVSGAFASILIFVGCVVLANWVRGGYPLLLMLSPAIILFFYSAKRANTERQKDIRAQRNRLPHKAKTKRRLTQ